MTTLGLEYLKYKETERSNVTRENETQRHNVATEEETHRTNVENERERKRSNLASEAETNRHNIRTETETERSNLAREAETNRANTVKEIETHRHNVATEKQARKELAEDKRQADQKNETTLVTNLVKYLPKPAQVAVATAYAQENSVYQSIQDDMQSTWSKTITSWKSGVKKGAYTAHQVIDFLNKRVPVGGVPLAMHEALRLLSGWLNDVSTGGAGRKF